MQEPNPFDLQFADEQDLDSSMEEGDETDDNDYDTDQIQENNFAILDSSLPGYSGTESASPHHLAAYANAKSRPPSTKEKRPHRARWHFGIRSRSPPMEVMAEIYRTLQTLGMEWKQKKDLGGLGGKVYKMQPERPKIERIREWDGDSRPRVDLKSAAGVYLVECRIRLDQVVVRFQRQLTSMNFYY
jgi:carbon catabolite-derepressing protein kinase